MNIAVDGDNFFHTGWLARLLALPREHPHSGALRPVEVAAFQDGWDTCNETPEGARLNAFYQMLSHNQAIAVWVDDHNSEIEGQWGD